MRRITVLAVVLSMLLMLTGCEFWMRGDRVSVEPYQITDDNTEQKTVKVSTYTQMRNALTSMVEAGTRSALLDVSDFTGGSVRLYADTAVRYVQSSLPLGAYAVESIDYEIGTSGGVEAVSIDITYRHERSRILQIVQAENMEHVLTVAGEALANADSYTVLRVTGYEEMDFAHWVQDWSAKNPDLVMEVPEVKASVFPEQGTERIIELEFTYQNSRDALRQMQQEVEPVFTAAELYVKNASQVREKYAQLYAFLMERSEYKLETSPTPTYSLLSYGVGDCRAFANVYAAMCRKAGLECYVVSGSLDGVPWTWNIVYFRGSYYHLDLVKSMQKGAFSPLSAADMSGYVWDHAAYPD